MKYDDIFPMSIKITQKIREKVYFLAFPESIKDKLLKLEEISNVKFNKLYQCLPTKTLKKIFITHLDGVVDMKGMSIKTNDKQWLISFQEFDIEKVVKILKVWIEAFYITETELDRPRRNGEKVKSLAKEIINDISIESFKSGVSCEDITLFENGQVVDNRGFLILPLKIVNKLVGDKIEFLNNAEIFYSSKNEIVTNPIKLKDKKGVDFYSYVIQFSVQTLPSHDEVYVNVNTSIRRWISRNETNKVPFLSDSKSAYIKVNDYKLQKIEAKYSSKSKKVIWDTTDYKCFNECYSGDNLPEFEEVIASPEKYISGNRKDIYFPFEYGISGINHNVESGMPFKDYKILFENIKKKLNFLYKKNEGNVIAKKVIGSSKTTPFFDDYFLIKNKEKFIKALNGAINNERLKVEIWYNDGEEDVKDALLSKLKNHLEDTGANINSYKLNNLSNKLYLEDEGIRENLKGFERRVKEIEKKLEFTGDPTICFIVLNGKEEFRNSKNKIDNRLDPKEAMRVGFARTGRLTQFITPKGYRNNEQDRNKKINYYKEKMKEYHNGKIEKEPRAIGKNYYVNTNIQHAILDGYRQLGVLCDCSKNKTLINKKVTGIYICNHKNTIYGQKINPFPIVITCDFEKNFVSGYCEFIGTAPTSYWKLILSLSKQFSKPPIESSKYMKLGINNIQKYICSIDNDNSLITLISDSTSYKLIEGISNKDIARTYEKSSSNQKDNNKINLDILNKSTIIRLRINDQVPDYYPSFSEKNVNNFKNMSGVFQYNEVFYSLDCKKSGETDTLSGEHSKVEKDKKYSHRNIIELYPLCISEKNKDKLIESLKAVHDLRSASLQYESQKTILPLPLHLAKKLEEYII